METAHEERQSSALPPQNVGPGERIVTGAAGGALTIYGLQDPDGCGHE